MTGKSISGEIVLGKDGNRLGSFNVGKTEATQGVVGGVMESGKGRFGGGKLVDLINKFLARELAGGDGLGGSFKKRALILREKAEGEMEKMGVFLGIGYGCFD